MAAGPARYLAKPLALRVSSGSQKNMRNEILRDMVFGCAGVLMVMAAIGLPPQVSAGPQMWGTPLQRDRLLPYYSPNPRHARFSIVGPGGPAFQTP